MKPSRALMLLVLVLAWIGTAGAGCNLSPAIAPPDACPAGSRPNTSSYAHQLCEGEVSGHLITQSGRVVGGCANDSGYALLCEVVSDPCKYGIQSMTRDEIVCNSTPDAFNRGANMMLDVAEDVIETGLELIE